jgi:hypothetical protein
VLLFAQGASPPPPQGGPRPYTQELRIVSDDNTPGMQLTSIADLITNEQGLIFTAHGSEHLIRVFDANGRFLRSFGRKGQGPGEFAGSTLKLETTIGDTVLVLDSDHNITTYFRSDGRVGRVVQPQGAWKDRIVVAPLLPDRALVKVDFFPGRVTLPRDSTTFWITDAAGRVITNVARDVKVVPRAHATVPGVTAIYGQPFLPSVKFATDHSGKRGVLALPYSEWNGTPGQVKLLVVNRDGVEAERILTLEARKVTTADVNAWIKKQLDALQGRASRSGTPLAAIEKQIRESLLPGDYLPVVEAIMMGRDGSIWIRPFWSETDWTVYPPAGTRTFTVRAPAGARLADISMARFWALTSDIDGLPVATRYRFTAP